MVFARHPHRAVIVLSTLLHPLSFPLGGSNYFTTSVPLGPELMSPDWSAASQSVHLEFLELSCKNHSLSSNLGFKIETWMPYASVFLLYFPHVFHPVKDRADVTCTEIHKIDSQNIIRINVRWREIKFNPFVSAVTEDQSHSSFFDSVRHPRKMLINSPHCLN